MRKEDLGENEKKRETKKIAPCDYIEELPGDPEKLLESDQHKHMYATFKIDGCWTKCPLKQMDLHFLDNSYQCRGGGMASNPLLQHLLDMHSSMMRSTRQPAVENDPLPSDRELGGGARDDDF